jgi:hypothetical protein
VNYCTRPTSGCNSSLDHFQYRKPTIFDYCNHIHQITVLLPKHTFHEEIEHNLGSLSDTTSLISFAFCLYQVRVITVFTVFRLLTDFVCLYTYEFWLSLCKIFRSSVILLLPLFKGHTIQWWNETGQKDKQWSAKYYTKKLKIEQYELHQIKQEFTVVICIYYHYLLLW